VSVAGIHTDVTDETPGGTSGTWNVSVVKSGQQVTFRPVILHGLLCHII